MKLHTLKPAEGSTKKGKRIARGQGSGRGGTSTRGHKGAQSRSGYSRKAGFEGGQMPLQRRVPKFGFRSPNRIETKPINLDTLQEICDKCVSPSCISPTICHNLDTSHQPLSPRCNTGAIWNNASHLAIQQPHKLRYHSCRSRTRVAEDFAGLDLEQG